MKLGVGDVTTGDGESHLRPKTVGSIKVERSVVFKPMAEDPVPEKISIPANIRMLRLAR